MNKKMELTLQQIQEFINKNKDNDEVKSYIGGFITTDRVEEFLSNEEGKKLLQPKLDTYFNKGLETFKSKTMPTLIDEEVKKRFPAKTDSEIELEKIKAELTKIQSEKLRESLTNKAIKVATEKKLPVDLIDYFVSDTEENTIKNIEKLEQVFQNRVESLVEERLKSSSSYVPAAGNGDGDKGLTKEDFKKMTYKERIELNQNNPELYKQLSK